MGKLTANIRYEDTSYRSPYTEMSVMSYSSFPGFTMNYKVEKNVTRFIDAKFDDVKRRLYVTDVIERSYLGRGELSKRALFETDDDHRHLRSDFNFCVSSSVIRTTVQE